MKLATREDINAPIEAVFEKLSDFDGFERAALRRGAEVVRTDTLTVPGPGMAWSAGFDLRGRTRSADLRLTAYDVPNAMTIAIQSSGLDVDLLVELVAMSRARTRMNVTVDASPHTIAARLMIQSLKLARSNVAKRFKRRVADFAADVEARCNGG
jgi:carbon monoxide dehydrogenase subunit G